MSLITNGFVLFFGNFFLLTCVLDLYSLSSICLSVIILIFFFTSTASKGFSSFPLCGLVQIFIVLILFFTASNSVLIFGCIICLLISLSSSGIFIFLPAFYPGLFYHFCFYHFLAYFTKSVILKIQSSVRIKQILSFSSNIFLSKYSVSPSLCMLHSPFLYFRLSSLGPKLVFLQSSSGDLCFFKVYSILIFCP